VTRLILTLSPSETHRTKIHRDKKQAWSEKFALRIPTASNNPRKKGVLSMARFDDTLRGHSIKGNPISAISLNTRTPSDDKEGSHAGRNIE